jgi:hypothetical protein
VQTITEDNAFLAEFHNDEEGLLLIQLSLASDKIRKAKDKKS